MQRPFKLIHRPSYRHQRGKAEPEDVAGWGFSSRAAVGDIVVTQLMVGGTERGDKDIEWQDFAFLFFFSLFLDSQGLNLTTIGHTHT